MMSMKRGICSSSPWLWLRHPWLTTPTQFLSAGSDYFRVLGASAISGRDFNDSDRVTGLPVAIVNQAFAATFCPDGRARILGLAPRLPTTITLLTAMTTNLLVRLRPLPVIGQGVLRFVFITAQLFSARPLHPELEGRAQISRCASGAGGRA